MNKILRYALAAGVAFALIVQLVPWTAEAANDLNRAELDALGQAAQWAGLVAKLGTIKPAARARPLYACYEAWSFYGLNQVTAGDAKSAQCTTPGSDRTTWQARLTGERAAADERISAALASQCSAIVNKFAQTGALGACDGCARPDFLEGSFKTMLKKESLVKRQELQLRNPAGAAQRLQQ